VTPEPARPLPREAGRLARADRDLAQARAEYDRIAEQVTRMQARHQQLVINAEVRQTRRFLLQALRRRCGADATAFLDEDFLVLADRPAIIHAIMVAATTAGGADACDLRLYDPESASLRTQARYGSGSSAAIAAAVLSTSEALFIDDIDCDPARGDSPALGQIRAAGFRAVRCYPLLTADGVAYGTLSLYYRQRTPRPAVPDLIAEGAARALSAARPPR
jgi:hypothetical protein